MVWDLAIGSGIPAPSDAIDVCVSKHQSALIGGDGDPTPPQGRRPENYRPPSRGAKAVVSCFSKKNDELRAQSEVICSRWEEQGAKRRSDGWPPRICSVEQYQITNALNLSESTYDGNLKMVSDRAK